MMGRNWFLKCGVDGWLLRAFRCDEVNVVFDRVGCDPSFQVHLFILFECDFSVHIDEQVLFNCQMQTCNVSDVD